MLRHSGVRLGTEVRVEKALGTSALDIGELCGTGELGIGWLRLRRGIRRLEVGRGTGCNRQSSDQS